MFRSCFLTCKGYLEHSFIVRGHSRNVPYLLTVRHLSCVGDHVFHEKLWDRNYVTSTFSYLYSTGTRNTPQKTSDSAVQKSAATSRKLKNDCGPMVTLIGTDNSLAVMALSEAEKIAKRRELKLVRIIDIDTKTQRPVYQLMTGSQYYNEDKKQRLEKSAKKESGLRGEKLLTLSHRITPHDLSSRMNNIRKWLSKTYEVRIVINGDSENMKCAEEVYDTIAESLKAEGRIVQKRQKGGDLRFQILPLKEETKESSGG